MFPLHIIRTESNYQAALATLHELTERDADGQLPPAEADYLDVLTLLVHDYEQRTSPVPPPDPIDAIRYRMQERGLRQRDLVPYIGTESVVSEVMNRKRRLTAGMVLRLARNLDLPAELLLQQADPA